MDGWIVGGMDDDGADGDLGWGKLNALQGFAKERGPESSPLVAAV